MVTIEGVDVPNNAQELTVEQFDWVNTTESNRELDVLDRWLKKFVYLGVPEEVFDDMDLETLQGYIDAFNEGWTPPTEKVLSVEIEGYTYQAKETIGVKDLSIIEKAWKKSPDKFAVKMCAVLFKRTDLSRTEHYTDAHLKHKESLFKDLPCAIAVPFVTDVIKTLIKNTEEINDSEPLEADNN